MVLKKEMNEHLLEFHKKHFRQVEDTPFAQEPLKSILGYCGDLKFADETRNGSSDIEALDVDQYTKYFLQELKGSPYNPPPIPLDLTQQDEMKGF
eukprot:10425569-Ditylum_brightwellii.AAC.1